MPGERKSKSALQSKTYGTSVALAVGVELFPQLGTWVSSHPQTAILFVAGLMAVLRHFTEGKIFYRRIPK